MSVPPPGSTPGPMMDLRARLRPMGIGGILDEAFRLYRENFALFVATCAVIEVPFQIIIVLLTFGLVGSIQPLTAINGTTEQNLTASQAAHLMQSYMQAVPTFFALLLATGLAWLVAFAIMSAALAIVISNRYLNRTVSVGQAYSAGAQRISALLLALVWIVVRFILLIIAVAILAGIVSAIHLLGIAVMPLTLPFAFAWSQIIGIAVMPLTLYLAIAWSLIPQAIVLDGVGGVASSRRSRQLVTGYWWKTCALVVVTAVLVFIVGRIPTVVLDVIIGATTTSPAVHTILDGMVGLIANILVLPLQFSAMTLLFYDLKIRKEAFDLEAMAQQAGALTPTVPT